MRIVINWGSTTHYMDFTSHLYACKPGQCVAQKGSCRCMFCFASGPYPGAAGHLFLWLIVVEAVCSVMWTWLGQDTGALLTCWLQLCRWHTCSYSHLVKAVFTALFSNWMCSVITDLWVHTIEIIISLCAHTNTDKKTHTYAVNILIRESGEKRLY